MTSIKPTKGPTGAASTEGASPASSVSSGEAFRAELDAARASKTADAQAAQSPFAAMARQVREGTLSREQVIDSLVQRQLSTPMAQQLPPVERARLESSLRDAIANDPALVALFSDAGLAP